MKGLFTFRRSPFAMKRLYNHISNLYGGIEKHLGPNLDLVVAEKIRTLPDTKEATALEYGCGSGLFTLKAARLFKSITAKDQSEKMLERAQTRAAELNIGNVVFQEGDLLNIEEKPESYDYVFVSFALHLFSLDDEIKILRSLFSAARKKVIVIDHNRRWTFLSAFVEWLEGSYYDEFIKTDFKETARQLECSLLTEEEIAECMVLSFIKE